MSETGELPTRAVEATGSSVEEAVATALRELGITREEAEVEVLSEGARVIPGERLSGARAQVRVRPVDPFAARARSLLEELLARMEIPARVTVRRIPAARPEEEGREPVLLDIQGDDLGLLIGWRGETLRALQTVLNLMAGDGQAEGRRIVLDVERYRARREEQVRELALRVAHRVKRTGQRFVLNPMQAYERRAVHLALAKDEGVRTESTGVEPERRVVIHPTGKAAPGHAAGRPPGVARGDRTGADRSGGPGGGPAGRPAPQRGGRPSYPGRPRPG